MRVDRYFRRYEEVTPQVLQAEHIDLLLCDLDYTLIPRWISRPTTQFVQWLNNLKRHNIEVAIISNNHSKKRVEKFVKNLCPAHNMLYLYQAKKPCPDAILGMIKYSGHCIRKTALLGDRIHTDIAAANGAGIKAWKVPHRFYC